MANGNSNNMNDGSSGLQSIKTIVLENNSYLIQLNSVQPHPINGQHEIPSSAYAATFTVTYGRVKVVVIIINDKKLSPFFYYLKRYRWIFERAHLLL